MRCFHIVNSLYAYAYLQNTCVLTWAVSSNLGWYAAAIQVEDFISSTSTTPMSSVPLQFLIFVFSNNQPCTGGVRPSLVDGEFPPDESCIPVPFMTTYTAGIVADSGGPSARYSGETCAHTTPLMRLFLTDRFSSNAIILTNHFDIIMW